MWQLDNEETPSQVFNRDQYLEPVQLNGLSNNEENAHPPPGPRLVPGQINEQEVRPVHRRKIDVLQDFQKFNRG